MAILISPRTLRILGLSLLVLSAVGAAFAIWFLNRDDNQVAPDDTAAGICCPSFECNDDTRFGEDTNYEGGACSTRHVACDGHGGYKAGSDGDQCVGTGDGGGDGGGTPQTCTPTQAPWTTPDQPDGSACCGGGAVECTSGRCSGTLGIVGECIAQDNTCTGGRVYCGGCIESCVDLTGYGGCNEYIAANCGGSGSNPYCPGTSGSTCNSGVNAMYGNNCDGSGNCTNPAGSSCTGEIHACDQGGGACINQVGSFGPGTTRNCIDIANSECKYVQLDVVCPGSGNSAITCYPTNCTPGGDDGGGDGGGDDGGGDDGGGDDGGGSQLSCSITQGLQCIDNGQVRVNWTAITNGFDVTSTSGRIVVRIDNTTNGWFTQGSDTWWATNYQAFIATGQNPESGSWVFDINPNTPYTIRTSVDPSITGATVEGLCSTVVQPLTCEEEEVPNECGDTCTANSDCRGGLVCSDNLCKIPACDGESCVCTPPSEENPDWAIEKTGAYVCQQSSTSADIEYEITVQNIGDGSGELPQIVDTLDSEVQSSWVVGGSISNGGTLVGRVITWNLSGATATFTPGESLTLTYTVRVPSTSFGSTFDNTVVANPTVGDDFTAQETVTVICYEPPVEAPTEPLPNTGFFSTALGKVGLGVFITSVSLIFVLMDDSDKLLLRLVNRGEKIANPKKRFESKWD